MCDQIAWMLRLPDHMGHAHWSTGAGAEVLLLPAIRLLPRAGKPTITTHILVSSAWTPEPLVFLLGLIKSPVGMRLISGLKLPLAVTGGGREGDWVMMAGWRSWRLGRLWIGSGSGGWWYSYYLRMAWVEGKMAVKRARGARVAVASSSRALSAWAAKTHNVDWNIAKACSKKKSINCRSGDGLRRGKACRRKSAVKVSALGPPQSGAVFARCRGPKEYATQLKSVVHNPFGPQWPPLSDLTADPAVYVPLLRRGSCLAPRRV